MADSVRFYDGFARVFDAWLETRSAGAESPNATTFYRDLAATVDGPALEVGAGTGRVYLDLLAERIDVDGIDVSADMLDRLREKADARGLDPSVRVADVTDFEPDREYGLVYAVRMFGHLESLADQRAAVQNIHDALAPGGVFALNVLVPNWELIVEAFGEPWEETVEVDGETHRLVKTNVLDDEIEQVGRWQWEVYRGEKLLTEREVPLVMIPKRQFELLFELAGFSNWTAYGGFDRSPLESVDQEMVWVAEA